MKVAITVLGISLRMLGSAIAQKLDVKIIDRQDKEAAYDYVAVYNNVAVGKTFKVRGATFTLQLPDDRLVVSTVKVNLPSTWRGALGIGEVVGCLCIRANRSRPRRIRLRVIYSA